MIKEKLEEKHVLERSEIVILPSEHGKKTSELIRDYILMQQQSVKSKSSTEGKNNQKLQYLDILFVGNKGADFSGSKDKYLGSTANEVICNTKLNVCFVIEKQK
jgi:hypothetical protein